MKTEELQIPILGW